MDAKEAISNVYYIALPKKKEFLISLNQKYQSVFCCLFPTCKRRISSLKLCPPNNSRSFQKATSHEFIDKSGELPIALQLFLLGFGSAGHCQQLRQVILSLLALSTSLQGPCSVSRCNTGRMFFALLKRHQSNVA